jgi:hypothetical protein
MKSSGGYSRFQRNRAGRGSYDFTGNWNPFKAAQGVLGSFNTADMALRNNLRTDLAEGMVRAENARAKSESLGKQGVSNFEDYIRTQTKLDQETNEDGTPMHRMPEPITSFTPGGKMTWSAAGNVEAARVKAKAKGKSSKRPDSTLAQDLGEEEESDAPKPPEAPKAPEPGEAPKSSTAGKVGAVIGASAAAVAEQPELIAPAEKAGEKIGEEVESFIDKKKGKGTPSS